MHRRENGARLRFVIDRAALKDAAAVLLPGLLVIIAAFWLASRFIRPAPPESFVMTTGAPGGAYQLFAERYRDIVAREGVRIDLRPSAGSIENLQRLRDTTSEVQAALVQSGVSTAAENADLVSLGSVYYEPLWIFYRSKARLSLLNELAGKRIAVGAQGSGTRALALQLLQAVGISVSAPEIRSLGGDAAAQALVDGAIDAAFVVGAPDAPLVQRLVQAPEVRLLSLANADAFARRFPFLSTLTLPRGVIDLAAPLPDHDVVLLAASANIVVRREFHPALAFLLLSAASEVHGGAGVLQRHREFPAARQSEFTLSDQAERYFKSGPPLLRRYLPFWLANLFERMVVLLLPLFAVLIPALKVLPALLEWRVKSRVFRWYGEIKFLEDELMRDPDPARVPEMLQRLDEIERGVSSTSVPMSYSDYAYNLRTHVEVVRNRVLRGAQAPASRAPLNDSES
ncbi:MAG: TAXI family TRAP transporter solute-binding subunit [Burkholderiales bacterium]|nr:TAXI family TRAP transporter solute-binding subunit [Burkholderiales bacterium]